MVYYLASNITSQALNNFLQAEETWAGFPWYVWLVIFLVAVFFLWWRLSLSAKKFNEEVKAEFDHQQESDHSDPHMETELTLSEEESAVELPETGIIEADDLTRIEGIGPKINSLLQAAGISTFQQLADADVERLHEIVEAAGLRMVNAQTWPEQARLAADGKWEDLAEWQTELKGGRHAE